MSNKAIEFYEAVLKFFKYDVDKGFVINTLSEDKNKVTINNKLLALPTREILTDKNVGDYLIFHPIPENVARGESDIIKKLVVSAGAILNVAISDLFMNLYTLAAMPNESTKLNSDQLELLRQVTSVDKTGLKNIAKVIQNATKSDVTKSFVSIYLKRGGVLGGKTYPRAAIVRFPMFETSESSSTTLHGVALRDKDFEAIKQIHKLIFPNIDQKEFYSVGSENKDFPYLHALLLACIQIVSKVMDINSVFDNVFEVNPVSDFDTSFMDLLIENEAQIVIDAKKTPAQPGNTAEAPVPQQPNTVSMQPSAMPPPMAPPSSSSNSDTVDISYMNSPGPFYPPNMQMMQPPMMQPGMMMPNMQQPMMMQPGMMNQPYAPNYPMQQPVMQNGYVQQPYPMQQPNGYQQPYNGMPMQQPYGQPYPGYDQSPTQYPSLSSFQPGMFRIG